MLVDYQQWLKDQERTLRSVRMGTLHDRSPVEISAHVQYMNERGLIQADVIDPIQASAPAPPWVIWDITRADRAML